MYQGIIHDLVVGMHNQKKDQSAIKSQLYQFTYKSSSSNRYLSVGLMYRGNKPQSSIKVRFKCTVNYKVKCSPVASTERIRRQGPLATPWEPLQQKLFGEYSYIHDIYIYIHIYIYIYIYIHNLDTMSYICYI